jgi:hypothetical protein
MPTFPRESQPQAFPTNLEVCEDAHIPTSTLHTGFFSLSFELEFPEIPFGFPRDGAKAQSQQLVGLTRAPLRLSR